MKNQRRRLIVNAPLQNRIILNVSWPPALALGVVALLLGVFCNQLTEEALTARVELPSLVPIFVTVVAFLLLASIYVFLNAVRFSHRVAGPMYRLVRTLEAVKKGDSTHRAHLRRGDFLTDVADGLNDFLDWLEEHPPDDDSVEAPCEVAEQR